MKQELHIVIAAAFLWCAGYIIAPLIAPSVGAELLYRWYSVVCHQFNSRSFHLFGEPFAVCIRCTSIYTSFLVLLILLRISARLRRMKFNTRMLLLISALPIAVDGILSLLSLYDSSTPLRILTGVMFGGGTALMLHLPLTETIHSLFSKKGNEYELET